MSLCQGIGARDISKVLLLVETAAHLCMLGTLQDRFFGTVEQKISVERGGRQGSHDSAGKHALPNAEGPSFQIIAIE